MRTRKTDLAYIEEIERLDRLIVYLQGLLADMPSMGLKVAIKSARRRRNSAKSHHTRFLIQNKLAS